jgi:polyhydroxyalkanoate synthesis regulator phasin
MDRTTKLRLTIAGSVAVLVGLGAAGAIAANKVLSPSQESKAVIDDAASRLGVTPAALTDALKQALKSRIDAAVASGRLTKEQADALKQRIDSDEFPLLGMGGFREHGMPGFHGAGQGRSFTAAASYLGLSETELRAQLTSGKTLADVAKAQGKSVSGLVDAMVAAAEKSIDQAVSDGKLTSEQADAVKADLAERITSLVNGQLEHFGMRGPHQGFMPRRGDSDGFSAFAEGPSI